MKLNLFRSWFSIDQDPAVLLPLLDEDLVVLLVLPDEGVLLVQPAKNNNMKQ